MITSTDICKALGTQQLCAGQVSGVKAGVHVMGRTKNNPNNEDILMVDAST